MWSKAFQIDDVIWRWGNETSPKEWEAQPPTLLIWTIENFNLIEDWTIFQSKRLVLDWKYQKQIFGWSDFVTRSTRLKRNSIEF